MSSHENATFARNVFDYRNYPFCRPLYQHLRTTTRDFIIGTIGFIVLLVALNNSSEVTPVFVISLTVACMGYSFCLLEISNIGDAYQWAHTNAKTTAELDQIYAKPPQSLTDEIAELQAALDLLRQIVNTCEAELEACQNEADTAEFLYHQEEQRHHRKIKKAKQSLNQAVHKLNHQLLGPEIELRRQALAAKQLDQPS